MNPLRIRQALLGLASAVLLSGCGSSQTTRYYSLQPSAARQPTPSTVPAGVLQITAFDIPALFDRSEIMKETSPGQFEVLEFDHWAAPFTQLARQTLSEDLAARLPAGALAFAGTPTPAGAIQLSVNLVAYRVVGGSAELEVSWSVKPSPGDAGGGTAAPVWQTSAAKLTAAAGDGSGAATVAALNDLLGTLSDRIVASLPTQ